MGALPDPRDPLNRMIGATKITDEELRILLHDSAREARIMINRYGNTPGNQIRKAQLDIARHHQRLWRAVGDHSKVALGDGVDAASESVAYMTSVYMESLGYNAAWMDDAI